MKEEQDSSTVDADTAELEQELAEARQLLRDINKPTPFRVELVGTVLLVLLLIGVAFIVHRLFPDVDFDQHDLELWSFTILAVPIILGSLWIGRRNKRKANINLKSVFQKAADGLLKTVRSALCERHEERNHSLVVACCRVWSARSMVDGVFTSIT